LGKALEMSGMPIRDFILNYCKEAGEPPSPMFTCTIAGTKSLFLADTRLVSLIYRDRPELDFRHLEHRFLTGVMGV
jgi:hypothetical protein